MARPTMSDVAAASGMSRSLVSLVFQDSPKVSEESRERILAAAEKLGYRPNTLARNLASTRTNTIGVLLDDLHNPFFADILDAIEDAAAAQEYRVLQAAGRRDKQRESDAIRTFIDHRVDGLILVAPRISNDELAAVAKTVPTVMIARRDQLPYLDVIATNEQQAAEQVIDHLVGLGHTHIAHLDGGTGPGSELRAHEYERAMKAHGLTPTVIPGDYTEAAGEAAASKLAKNPKLLPTAMVCASDIEAAGVAAAFANAHIAIPNDVSLVGYDNTALAQLSLLNLTSVEQPTAEMAERAIELITKRLDEPKRTAAHLELTPSLVVRGSTSTPRKQ